MRYAITAVLVLVFSLSQIVSAQEQIEDLDQLLAAVKQQQAQQRELNRQREREFMADKRQQQQLLQRARSDFEKQQQENQPLLAVTESNASEIDRLEKELAEVVGDMGDLSSTFREFAGDFSAVLRESMLSAQLPERLEIAQSLADANTQASIEEIQSLWLLLQEDMTESGKVAQFQAPVIDSAGAMQTGQVLRVGVFSAWKDGDFLRYVPETGELLSLSRQPPSRFRAAAREFASADGGLYSLAIDPTRGSLLGMLSFTPDLRERIEQGGTIGLIIIGLGLFGLALTLWRLSYLLVISRRIHRQLQNLTDPSNSNPLGRVLLAVESVSLDEDELLQLKLDEAVLAEIPALERGNGLIKLFAATSPLLGLLGTVTGMILTFQAISLFGTGDPKLMAGGISQALMTTVLGLVVAIPLLFGHSVVAYLSRIMVQRLDEQCAGVLARSAEQQEH
ncbi:MAG: MotA/TolQ/ExbB proton channel family protein [Halioglobus sp.]